MKSMLLLIAGALVSAGAVAADTRTVTLEVSRMDCAVCPITVRKALKSDSASVSGIGSLLTSVLSARGRTPSVYTPDVRASQNRREGVDAALRAAIDHAVLELTKRFER